MLAGHPHYQLPNEPLHLFLPPPPLLLSVYPLCGHACRHWFYWTSFPAVATASSCVINMITLMAFSFYCLSSNAVIDHSNSARFSIHALTSPSWGDNYPNL